MNNGNSIRARSRTHMPMVLLTLLSILQALALELLWSYVTDHPYLLQVTWAAALGWLQVIATLLGILLIWLLYSSMTMRFSWVPSTSDSLLPFAIGILEFAMIAQIGIDSLWRWFIVLGLIFGIATWAMQLIMRRARLDGENDDFFSKLRPANVRDFYPTIAVVLMLFGFGIGLRISGHQNAIALLGLLLAIGALGYQMYLSHHHWVRSVEPAPPAV
jgi:hypothetical protein